MIAIGSSTAGSIDTARSGIDMLCDRCGAFNPAGSKECRNCAERLSTDRVETAAFSIAFVIGTLAGTAATYALMPVASEWIARFVGLPVLLVVFARSMRVARRIASRWIT